MSISKPFFTIITPTYNSENYLDECIKSIESQEFKDWEHVFIDSFSSDRTMSILRAYKKRHPHKVKIYQYPKNGISDAFNKGIKKSSGKYINFLGSDDLLEKNALTIVHKNMCPGNYSWCFGDFTKIDEFGDFTKSKNYHFEPLVYPNLLIHLYICHQTVFSSRKLFDNFGYFKNNLHYCMDHDFIMRIWKNSRFLYIPKFLSRFRITGKNPSSFRRLQFIEKNEVIFANSTVFLSLITAPFRFFDFYLYSIADFIKKSFK